MFCSKCGKEIDDKAYMCVHCGATTEDTAPKPAPKVKNDSGSFGWAVLGFFFPIAGLIVWLAGKDSTPKNARLAGIGAIVGTIVEFVSIVLFYVVYFVFILALSGAASYM